MNHYHLVWRCLLLVIDLYLVVVNRHHRFDGGKYHLIKKYLLLVIDLHLTMVNRQHRFDGGKYHLIKKYLLLVIGWCLVVVNRHHRFDGGNYYYWISIDFGRIWSMMPVCLVISPFAGCFLLFATSSIDVLMKNCLDFEEFDDCDRVFWLVVAIATMRYVHLLDLAGS